MTRSLVLMCRSPSQPADLAIERDQLPPPTGHQVLVEVQATSVNPIDVKRAGGYGRRLLALKGAGRFPLVLGNDVVGVVRAAGAAAAWRAGQRVFGVLPPARRGTHAGAVLVDGRWLRAAPERIAAERLCVLPYTFTTAVLALRATGLDRATAPGRRVLVHGAAGGLGRLALQLLVSWGARVTAICSTADVTACEALGAQEVLDRRRARIESLDAKYDVSLNFAAWSDDSALLSRLGPYALGNATTVHPLLDHFDGRGWLGGACAALRDLRRQRARLAQRAPQARYRWVVFRPDGDALDALQALIATGAPLLPVGTVLPLARAAEAFTHMQERRGGRAVLLPGSP